MKKILAITLSLVMMAMVFTGCSKTDAPVDDNKPVDVGQEAEGNLTDGFYLTKTEVSDHGIFAMATLEVKDGQIVGVDYAEVAIEASEGVEEGDRKTEDNYDFHVPFEISKNLQKQIIDNNGIESLELDSLTGATSTRTIMIELVDEALNTAK